MKVQDHHLQVPGLRMTKQRKEVYRALLEKQDHPSAAELHEYMQTTASPMSLATVYNCLEAFVEHGAVKQVNVDREPTRYCENSLQHGHFHDQQTGKIHDINFKEGMNISDLLDLPPGTEISNIEITLKGSISQ